MKIFMQIATLICVKTLYMLVVIKSWVSKYEIQILIMLMVYGVFAQTVSPLKIFVSLFKNTP